MRVGLGRRSGGRAGSTLNFGDVEGVCLVNHGVVGAVLNGVYRCVYSWCWESVERTLWMINLKEWAVPAEQ